MLQSSCFFMYVGGNHKYRYFLNSMCLFSLCIDIWKLSGFVKGAALIFMYWTNCNSGIFH